MKKEQQVIGPIEAIVSKLTTSVDGSYKITLDIAGDEDKENSAKLLELALTPTVILMTIVKTTK